MSKENVKESAWVPAVMAEEELPEVYEQLEGNTNREKMQKKYQEYALLLGYPSVEDMIADIKLNRIFEHLNAPDWEQWDKQRLSWRDKLLLAFLESIGADMGHREQSKQFFIKSNVQKLGNKMFS